VNDHSIATYYILDLDRTLFDTEKSTQVMRGVVALHDTELAAALEQRFEESTLLGESFSMRDFIAENVDEEAMQKIETLYLAAALNQDILNPGARELISYIRTQGDGEMGILTYGSPLGQAMKIKAVTELESIPFLITSETFKGAQIASWHQEDGYYHLPAELGGFLAKHIVFVDDKPFSFKGLPIDCTGYLVKSLYDAGIGKIPLNVATATDLHEVITAEKHRLTMQVV